MTNEHDRERTAEETPRASRESDFARVSRAGAEAMARRPIVVDEQGRRVTDPGQEMRAPEERSSVDQARRGEDEPGGAR
ncbi:MAG: hypothetical protein AB7G21_02800 [Dehalococcoidia bacterium]